MEKNKKDLITIIVPVYKVERYLDKCVQSIVSQTYQNLEIILVDDGSPDACRAMCDEWAKRDMRIRVVHKPNGGLSSARNAGLDVAHGKYIMFIDSDDFVEPTIAEDLLKAIQSSNADFAACKVKLLWQNKVAHNTGSNIVESFDQQELVKCYLNGKIQYIEISCAKLFKSDIFKNTRYDESKKSGEDLFLFLHIVKDVTSFVYVDKPLYNYIQRKSSIVGQKSLPSIKATESASDEIVNVLVPLVPQLESEIYYKHYLNLKRIYNKLNSKVGDYSKEVLFKAIESLKKSGKATKKDKIFCKMPKTYRNFIKIKQKLKNLKMYQ